MKLNQNYFGRLARQLAESLLPIPIYKIGIGEGRQKFMPRNKFFTASEGSISNQGESKYQYRVQSIKDMVSVIKHFSCHAKLKKNI